MGLKLGDISPLAGVVTGKGAFGNLANSGALGLGAALLTNKDKGQEVAEAAAIKKAEIAKKLAGMKKGGKVSSASKRADGCANKGKTKGRMV
jgi:hypothetical protein